MILVALIIKELPFLSVCVPCVCLRVCVCVQTVCLCGLISVSSCVLCPSQSPPRPLASCRPSGSSWWSWPSFSSSSIRSCASHASEGCPAWSNTVARRALVAGLGSAKGWVSGPPLEGVGGEERVEGGGGGGRGRRRRGEGEEEGGRGRGRRRRG